MQNLVENQSAKIDIEKGKFFISIVIGVFAFDQIISLFTGSFNISRILLGSLLLFLVYEGYDWARILWGILSAMGAIFGAVAIVLALQKDVFWGIVFALSLVTLSSIFVAVILFFSNEAIAFLESRKNQPKYPSDEIREHPRPSPQYHELSEKVRANFNGELPTYEITTALPVPNSNEQIVLMNYIQAFRNVFRCDQNGSVIWQAELPTELNDVYTNIEWKENQLMAFSRSCISVVLDIESGKIISPKNAT